MARKKAKEVELGDICRDRISGYTGTVVCIAAWLAGCRRVTLQAKTKPDGSMIDMQTFDEPLLEYAGEAKEKPVGKTGGPPIAPSQHGTPSR